LEVEHGLISLKVTVSLENIFGVSTSYFNTHSQAGSLKTVIVISVRLPTVILCDPNSEAKASNLWLLLFYFQ